MSDNIILTDRHNGLVICTIPLAPLYKDMNGYVAIFIKIAISQNRHLRMNLNAYIVTGRNGGYYEKMYI